MHEDIERMINEQITFELYSAYLYYSMANHFEAVNLSGAAHWMRSQVLEEMGHAAKFASFLNNRQGRVLLGQIDAPPTEWESPLAAFQEAYHHETLVTARINKLVDAALEKSDHAAANFLQWFVAEQVEEEASTDAVVQQLKLVENSQGGLFMLDKELAGRPLALPPDLTGAGA